MADGSYRVRVSGWQARRRGSAAGSVSVPDLLRNRRRSAEPRRLFYRKEHHDRDLDQYV